jgi:hypothetical protein
MFAAAATMPSARKSTHNSQLEFKDFKMPNKKALAEEARAFFFPPGVIIF